MERSLKALLFVFALLTIPAIHKAQTTTENSQEKIEDRISRALEEGNNNRLTVLIKENR